jgi:vancomycin resistance protein YoaR
MWEYVLRIHPHICPLPSRQVPFCSKVFPLFHNIIKEMNTPSPLARFTTFILIGISTFVVALSVFVLGFQIVNRGKIYPGVRVAWVDLAGMTTQEATETLSNKINYSMGGRLLLRDGDQMWVAYPAQAGLYFGSEQNAQAAYKLGRTGTLGERLSTQLTAWYEGINLTPEFIFDEYAAQKYLETLATEIDLPTVEASLSIDGIEVVVNPGQVGRSVDIPASLEVLLSRMQSLQDAEIPLTIREDPPAILDVSEQADLARQILSEPLVITAPKAEAGPWRFEPMDLAEMLTIERISDPQGDYYQVGLDTSKLRLFLEEIAPSFERQRANARFTFNDETRQLEVIQPAVTGQSVDIEATIQNINEKLIAGEHRVSLDMEYTLPEVGDDATAESLGITELVHAETTYFRGSGSSRIQNITIASSRFHGVLVAPGETFSMGDILGDVSLDTGYEEAWIIYGDRTIKGVGGGVCQVSTTLFRTVFFSGFPVVERHPHAYRVYYYEQTYTGYNDDLAGLDATVYVPLVDFKFTNDTPYWLLMETYVVGNSLTWKFYSTADGRTIEWETSGLTNKQDPPEPTYQENEKLNKGEIKQVDWAVDGADVTVSRYVWRDGKIIDDDIFTTHYMPWRAVCEYGPGTKGMPPAKIDPDDPCKPSTKKD